MGDLAETLRTRFAHVRIPRVYLLVVVAYVPVRIYAVLGSTVAGSFPDTPTYRRAVTGPAYPLVSLTGHAMRPWVSPLLFAILPSDNVRSAAQLVLSIGAWITLATVVALALHDRRVRMTAFVVILLFSTTTAITSWDRVIGAESTAISLAVLALAAWIRFVSSTTALNAVAVIVTTTLWSFTKSGVFPVVALAALIVLVSLVAGREQRLRAIVAVVLVVVAAWGAVANARSDTEYEAFNDQGLSQFSGNFATLLRLEILNHPSERTWFVQHGMPDPSGLAPFELRTPVDTSWMTGEQDFLTAYLARKDLTHWVDTKGQHAYAEYLATHPGRVAARFSAALPYLLTPPRYDLVYAGDVREVMPAVARNLFFATTTGPHLPRAVFGDVGLLLVLCAGLLFVPRRRKRDTRLLAVAGVAFALCIVAIALGWVLSPIEIVRHAIPATIVLRLALWMTLFALVDAALPDRVPDRAPTADVYA